MMKQLSWDDDYLAKTPFGDYKVRMFKTFVDYEEETGTSYIWCGHFNGAPIFGGTVIANNKEEAMEQCQKHFEESLKECVYFDEVQAYRNALDPNKTKHIYMGEVTMPVTEIVYCDENSEEPMEITRMHTVDWTTVKKIMAMINQTAKEFLDESRCKA